ncbi:MAG: YfhO family protein, partial [Chloroflexi bacterium]|nr:YfhO family protein [Chloroflexota bacterium]
PTTVRAIEITTFVEGATNLPDGFVAGEIELRRADGMLEKFPLRIGIETAEWDYERASAENKITHRRAEIAHSFPAFTRAFARAFDGNTYRARFEFAPHEIVGIKVHALLPPTRLIVENIFFTDVSNQTISLATLTGKNNFSIAYWSDTVAVWKNLDALPRAFIAHAAQVLNDDAAFARLRENDFQPAQSVLLAEENSVGELKSQASGVDSVRVTRAEPERVEIFARTDQRGYLLLADSWYPGWNARVDGIATPIYRADIIFRAVALEPGEHTIIFEYQPISFALGGALSALSLFITFAFARRMARAGEAN